MNAVEMTLSYCYDIYFYFANSTTIHTVVQETGSNLWKVNRSLLRLETDRYIEIIAIYRRYTDIIGIVLCRRF